jgi:hypothetical protein
MKHPYGAIALLLALIPIPPQGPQSAGGLRLETKYDGVTDMTTVQCNNLVKWGEAPEGLSVQANVSFHGKERDRSKEAGEPVNFWFFLSSNKGGATRHTQPSFQDAATLFLDTDKVRLVVPVKEYHSAFYELVRSLSESARAEMSHEDLRKLLGAKSLKGKWGAVEFKFSDASLASLQSFVSHQVFATEYR